MHNPDITTIIATPNPDEPIPDSPQSLGKLMLIDATLIFGADIDETYTENCTILLICLTEEIPKGDNAAEQGKKQADSSVKKKISASKDGVV